MKFLGIDMPANRYWLAKDIATVIYNKERKLYPDLDDYEYLAMFKKRIQKRYAAAKGTKTLIEVLKEYRADLRKKEGV